MVIHLFFRKNTTNKTVRLIACYIAEQMTWVLPHLHFDIQIQILVVLVAHLFSTRTFTSQLYLDPCLYTECFYDTDTINSVQFPFIPSPPLKV